MKKQIGEIYEKFNSFATTMSHCDSPMTWGEHHIVKLSYLIIDMGVNFILPYLIL